MASSAWTGHLTFGLVSFPIRLNTAARKKRLPLHYVHKLPPQHEPEPRPAGVPEAPAPSSERAKISSVMTLPTEPLRPNIEPAVAPVARIKQEIRNASDDRPVQRQDLLKGYEIAPEQFVTFTNEELHKIRPKTSPDMEIVRSVRLADIDPVYFETSYYVVPGRGGERPYALIYTALQETKYVAIAKVAMHGREHIMIVRPGNTGLLAHTMFYPDEIRAESEFHGDVGSAVPKELDLAKAFVDAIKGPFAPEEFKDSYQEQVEQLITGKMERNEVASSSPASRPAVAPVVNILDALKQSLEMLKQSTKPDVERRAPGQAKASTPQRRARVK